MTNFPYGNQDENIWIKFNNWFHALSENLYIELNGNNPPTIKQTFRCNFYNTDNTYNIPASPATGDNEYTAGSTPTYRVDEAVWEDDADVTFTWGGTVRGETIPAQSDGTWYILCKGSYDNSSSTIGQGKYNFSKTETPIPSVIKNGAYSAAGNRVLGSFTSSGGVVSGLSIYDNRNYLLRSNPSFAPVQLGQFFTNTTNNSTYIASGVGATSGWHLLYRYGTATVTGGGGDVTINLGGNWERGYLVVFVSTTAANYTNTGGLMIYQTTYDALTDTDGTYTNEQVVRMRDGITPDNLSKTAGIAGQPKSATATSVTFTDDGVNTAYIKYILIA